MENNKKGGANSGFTLGFVLGTALTLLYATKTGKKILKVVSEEGGQGIGEIKKHLKELNIEISEDILDDESLKQDDEITEVPVVNENGGSLMQKDEVEKIETPPSVGKRKLFKGIPKK